MANVSQPEIQAMEEDENEEEKPLKTSPLPSEEFAIAYSEGEEEEEDEEEEEVEEEEEEEDEDDDEEDEISSQLLNAGKEEEAEGEVGNDLDELKEIMFSNVDSDVPLSWKEDLEDSETEMDNFVSQFTIWFKKFFFFFYGSEKFLNKLNPGHTLCTPFVYQNNCWVCLFEIEFFVCLRLPRFF